MVRLYYCLTMDPLKRGRLLIEAKDALDHARGVKEEQMALGKREIYIFYGDGMADSRLVIPAAMTIGR